MSKQKIKRLLFSLLLALVSLELSLQLAHVIARRAALRSHRLPTGVPVILCVGDSHTYGVVVPDEESYPSQLQRMLSDRGLRASVVNDGIPGQNSSELRRRLPGLLAEYQPAVVVIMISANNEWNSRDTIWSDRQDGVLRGWARPAWSFLRGWASSSVRTVRLFTYLYNQHVRQTKPMERVVSRDGTVYFHDWRGEGRWEAVPQVIDRTRRDLFAIISQAKKAGAYPILMTYPSQPFSPMGGANSQLLAVAKPAGVPVVDNGEVISRLIMRPDGSMDQAAHDRLFLTDPGETHLAGPGYAVVAAGLAEVIARNDALGAGQ